MLTAGSCGIPSGVSCFPKGDSKSPELLWGIFFPSHHGAPHCNRAPGRPVGRGLTESLRVQVPGEEEGWRGEQAAWEGPDLLSQQETGRASPQSRVRCCESAITFSQFTCNLRIGRNPVCSGEDVPEDGAFKLVS